MDETRVIDSGGQRGAESTEPAPDGAETVLDRPTRVETLVATGTSLGCYVVLEELGRDGMGQVLRAYDPELQREVALKVVRADALDEGSRSRMRRGPWPSSRTPTWSRSTTWRTPPPAWCW